MKLKPKLRHFWRNNKTFVSMYCAAANLGITLALWVMSTNHPALIVCAMYFTSITALWFLLWIDDYRVKVLKRMVKVSYRLGFKSSIAEIVKEIWKLQH